MSKSDETGIPISDIKTTCDPDVIEISIPEQQFRDLREALTLDTSGIVRPVPQKKRTYVRK